MAGMDWPSFSTRLLDAPAEDWGRLPTSVEREWGDDLSDAEKEADEEAISAQLLADLEDAFLSAGGNEDRAKALETIQTFVNVRRIRLIEDLMILTLSLGEEEGDRRTQPWGESKGSAPEDGKFPRIFLGNDKKGGDGDDDDDGGITRRKEVGSVGANGLSSIAGLKRELAVARKLLRPQQQQEDLNFTPTPTAEKTGGVLLSEGGAAEEGLRTAAGQSTEEFFDAWAKKFKVLSVHFEREKKEGNSGGDSGGAGGSKKKDDREIQAARDVERDTLRVNGVLVKGSEGYAAVVGRVKRELGRLAEPVTGSDGPSELSSSSAPPRRTASRVDKSLQSDSDSPLRPPKQLENFSKLLLKAANRTESGGLSFDAIYRVLELCPSACDGSVLVVPDSSKAEPLGINIAAEGFRQKGDTPSGPLERFTGAPELQGGLHAFGVCAHVEAVTVYSLYSADMESVHLQLRATFRNSLRLALSPFSRATCEAFGDVGYRGEDGEVELEVVEGPHISQH